MRICIDPGHGGRDPGAVGPTGVKEKNIVLGISNHLINLLEVGREKAARLSADIERVESRRNERETRLFFQRTGGIEKYLESQRRRLEELSYTEHYYFFTRLADTALTLGRRVLLSQTGNADIFISLHCNGFRRQEVHGTETFFHADSVRGRLLAQAINSQIVNTMNWQNRGIKPNRTFAVLRGYNAAISSVLVEFDFITNPQRERDLANSVNQKKLAEVVLFGIRDYLA